MLRSARLVAAATLWSLTSISCGGSTPSPSAPTSASTSTAPATLVSATMSGANVTLTSVGQTTQIVVTGRFSDGTTADITRDTGISSSDFSVASANPTALVTAWGPGTAVLTAIYQRNPVRALASGTVTVLSGPPADAAFAPTLTSPADGATLPNGCGSSGCNTSKWTFSWTPVTNATAYHLVVHGPSPAAEFALVDYAGITDTTFSLNQQGIVYPPNTNGWTWTVQAQVNGVFRTWSVARTFNVTPP